MSKQQRFFLQMVDGSYLVLDRKHNSLITNDTFIGAGCTSAGDADVFVKELNGREEQIETMEKALEAVSDWLDKDAICEHRPYEGGCEICEMKKVIQAALKAARGEE